jgi:hypothetical protein
MAEDKWVFKMKEAANFKGHWCKGSLIAKA